MGLLSIGGSVKRVLPNRPHTARIYCYALNCSDLRSAVVWRHHTESARNSTCKRKDGKRAVLCGVVRSDMNTAQAKSCCNTDGYVHSCAVCCLKRYLDAEQRGMSLVDTFQNKGDTFQNKGDTIVARAFPIAVCLGQFACLHEIVFLSKADSLINSVNPFT